MASLLLLLNHVFSTESLSADVLILNHERQPDVYVFGFGLRFPSTNQMKSPHFIIYKMRQRRENSTLGDGEGIHRRSRSSLWWSKEEKEAMDQEKIRKSWAAMQKELKNN